jgi:hypothetical protein
MILEEKSIFLEVIVSVIEKKVIHVNTGRILNVTGLIECTNTKPFLMLTNVVHRNNEFGTVQTNVLKSHRQQATFAQMLQNALRLKRTHTHVYCRKSTLSNYVIVGCFVERSRIIFPYLAYCTCACICALYFLRWSEIMARRIHYHVVCMDGSWKPCAICQVHVCLNSLKQAMTYVLKRAL